VGFWFTPIDPVGLHTIRVLAGLLFLSWLLPFAGQAEPLFGLQGWFDQKAFSEAARLPGGPPQLLGWSILYLFGSNSALLTAVYWLAVLVLVLFTLGIGTRLMAVLTWVVVASFTAAPAVAYDGDALLLILAFYLMAGYVFLDLRRQGLAAADRLLGPWDASVFSGWLRRGADRKPSLAANVVLRLLQVHLAIVMLASGLHKLQTGEWWSGTALWYPLHPPFQTTAAQVRALSREAPTYLAILSVAAYATLAWQIGFPAFAWRPRWRPLLLGGAVVGWLGTAFIYDLPLFGPAIFIGCLAYLTPDEWYRLFGWLGWVPGLSRLRDRLPAPGETGEGGARREKVPSFAVSRRP
jgi:hypothetical protein